MSPSRQANSSSASPELENSSASPARSWLHRKPLVGSCLLALSMALLLGCYDTGFLPYDDSSHTYLNQQVVSESVAEAFLPEPGSTYFPLTVLSYKADRAVFNEPGLVKSPRWAQGIRFMNAVYHAAAAFVLWRIFLTLGLSATAAFLSAAFFAGHPLACETVCWISERKNVLAGLFGFSAIWAFIQFRSTRGLAVAILLYAAALLGKPSALGLLPVFVFLEVFIERRWITLPIAVGSTPETSAFSWLKSVLRLLPMFVLCALVLPPNLKGFSDTIIPPPGGSAFTAVLTATEILVRYLKNILLPTDLSVGYYVQPIASVADARLWMYSALLAAVVAITVWLARERRLALLGWLWFFAALGPHYNLISIPSLMQDRYSYLAVPGVLIAVASALSGLLQRVSFPPRIVPLLGGTVVLAIAAMGFARGALFANTHFLFSDAVAKQPQSAHAQYGMSLAWRMFYESMLRSGTAPADELAEANRKSGEHALLAAMAPDAERQLHYSRIFAEAGAHLWRTGSEKGGRALLDQAIRGLKVGPRDKGSLIEAHTIYSELCLEQNLADEALALARKGAELFDRESRNNLARAKAALAVAEKSEPAQRKALIDEARECLARIPKDSEYSKAAQGLSAKLP